MFNPVFNHTKKELLTSDTSPLGGLSALKALQELSAASPHFRAAADSASVPRVSQSVSCHSCQLQQGSGEGVQGPWHWCHSRRRHLLASVCGDE